MRTYTELITFDTLEERFDYLALSGGVGLDTFGHDRWMNQAFYRSREWKLMRNHVIARDMGYEMALEGWHIKGSPYIHHMNPLVAEDIEESTENLLDPEFLISVSHSMHNRIHYGDRSQLPRDFVPRSPGDTKRW